jgi:hypothetical protein
VFRSSELRAGFVGVIAASLLAAVATCVAPAGASSARAASATFLGPVLTRAENATTSWGRDGGVSVPLPNGTDLWIFGDTPRYQYEDGTWKLTYFIGGGTAGEESFKPGHPLAGPLDEVVLGRKLAASNQPTQFLPSAHLYMPDGTGRSCTKANGGQATSQNRWLNGAVLMPDKTNVLIPYLDVCVLSAGVFQVEGWGFSLYDWRSNKLSVPPIDVFPASSNGAPISRTQYFGSPIVAGNKVTFFSSSGGTQGNIYTTTVAANTKALKNAASYIPQPIAGLPVTSWFSVAPRSSTQPRLTMIQIAPRLGQYTIYTAAAPAGPWSNATSGTLPRCVSAPTQTIPGEQHCGNSVYVHPELSSSSKLFVSYYLAGYGPGISGHPDPTGQLHHLVSALLPV